MPGSGEHWEPETVLAEPTTSETTVNRLGVRVAGVLLVVVWLAGATAQITRRRQHRVGMVVIRFRCGRVLVADRP